jgi:hypothetical protein
MSHAKSKPESSPEDAAHLIKALSEELHVPAQQVGEVYCNQLSILAAEARIQDFVGVLALRNARAILRTHTAQRSGSSRT